MEEVPEAARRLMKAFWPGPLTLLLPRTPRRAGRGDGRAAAGGRAHAGASGGAGADPARRGSGGRAQRQPLWPHQPHDRRARAGRSGRAHRCGAGRGPDAARRRVYGARSLAKPDDDLPAGRGDGGADSRGCRAGGDFTRAASRCERRRRKRCRRRAWGCGTMRPGRGWCWWKRRSKSSARAWREAARRPAGRADWASCCRLELPRRLEIAAGRVYRVGPVGRARGAGAEALCRAARARCRRMHRDSLSAAGAEGLGAAIATGC